MWRNDVYNLWCFVALNCYKISFLAIYAVLLRFFVAIHALLCGEKLSQKLCLWREKDKYHVWLPIRCRKCFLDLALVNFVSIEHYMNKHIEYTSEPINTNWHRCLRHRYGETPWKEVVNVY